MRFHSFGQVFGTKSFACRGLHRRTYSADATSWLQTLTEAFTRFSGNPLDALLPHRGHPDLAASSLPLEVAHFLVAIFWKAFVWKSAVDTARELLSPQRALPHLMILRSQE